MNKILETLEAEREELADWRHDFHMHPELGLEETRTAGIVAQKLRSWGIEVTEHVGVTGVVGVINGDLGPGRSIGLRCDMDALPITECSSQSWKSTVKGKMHACGHDGHTTMLLAAARYLSQHRNFRGRVVLVFQPDTPLLHLKSAAGSLITRISSKAPSRCSSSRPKKVRAAPWP